MKWNNLSTKDKIKKIAKYTVNTLNFINMILLGLAEIWGWGITSYAKSIIVITGAISTYLVGGKIFETEYIEDDNKS